MKFVKLGLLTSAMALAAGTVSAGEIAVIVKTTVQHKIFGMVLAN